MPNKAILLVEDNEVDELLTLRAIATNGIANPVVVARDGEEALQILFGEGPAALPAGPVSGLASGPDSGPGGSPAGTTPGR